MKRKCVRLYKAAVNGLFPTVHAVNQEERKKTRLLREATMTYFSSDLHDASLKGRRSRMNAKAATIGSGKWSNPGIPPLWAPFGSWLQLL